MLIFYVIPHELRQNEIIQKSHHVNHHVNTGKHRVNHHINECTHLKQKQESPCKRRSSPHVEYGLQPRATQSNPTCKNQVKTPCESPCKSWILQSESPCKHKQSASSDSCIQKKRDVNHNVNQLGSQNDQKSNKNRDY